MIEHILKEHIFIIHADEHAHHETFRGAKAACAYTRRTLFATRVGLLIVGFATLCNTIYILAHL